MSIQIIKLTDSPLKNKRYRVYLNTEQHYDFGLKGGQTYLEHHDTNKRINYYKRHLANKKEYNNVQNLIPSASLFSAILLWGPYTNIKGNIKYLNDLWKRKASC